SYAIVHACRRKGAADDDDIWVVRLDRLVRAAQKLHVLRRHQPRAGLPFTVQVLFVPYLDGVHLSLVARQQLFQESVILGVVVRRAVFSATGARPGRSPDDAEHDVQTIVESLIDNAVVDEPLSGIRAGVNGRPLDLDFDPVKTQLVGDRVHGGDRVADGGVTVDLDAVAKTILGPGEDDTFVGAGLRLRLWLERFFGLRLWLLFIAAGRAGRQRGRGYIVYDRRRQRRLLGHGLFGRR